LSQVRRSGPGCGAELTAWERALLERHLPILRFDRQYDYRPASVLAWSGTRATFFAQDRASWWRWAGGGPALSLDPLSGYPEDFEAEVDDWLRLTPDLVGDPRRTEGSEP
jgi:hypothetical protein